MKKVLVLSSSGLDSTYLVYDNLKKGNRVTALYTEITNNSDKVEVEKKALENQEVFFRKTFPCSYYTLKLDCIKVSLQDFCSDLIFDQMPIWIWSIVMNTGDIDEVQIGYVMNDDAVSYLQEIKDIYNQFSLISRRKLPELTFPLSKSKKRDFISELPKELLENVTFCEWPSVIDGVMKPCGGCPACKRYKNENLYNEIIIENHKTYTVKSEDLVTPIKNYLEKDYGCLSSNCIESVDQNIMPYQYKLDFPNEEICY